MADQEMMAILEENKKEYSEIFLNEWNALTNQREERKREDYRERYIIDLDQELEQVLDSAQSVRSEEREDVRSKKGKIIQSIEYGVWKVACKLKDDNDSEGEPVKELEDFFNSGNIGATIIDQLLQQVFTAIGLVWGGFTTIITSAIGKAVVKWVNGRIAAKCDEIVETKAKAFCKIPLNKPT